MTAMSLDMLTAEERARVGMQVDYFVELLAKRYDLDPSEVIDAVRWVQTHREFMTKMKSSSFLALITVLVSAFLLATWEGIKAFARGEK